MCLSSASIELKKMPFVFQISFRAYYPAAVWQCLVRMVTSKLVWTMQIDYFDQSTLMQGQHLSFLASLTWCWSAVLGLEQFWLCASSLQLGTKLTCSANHCSNWGPFAMFSFSSEMPFWKLCSYAADTLLKRLTASVSLALHLDA